MGSWRAAPVRAADACRSGRPRSGRLPARVLRVGARELRRPAPVPAVPDDRRPQPVHRLGAPHGARGPPLGPLAGEGQPGAGAAAQASTEGAVGAGEGEPFAPAVVAVADAYVQSLPDELRRIHHQRFVVGSPQRQAAEALGISRQTLRTLEKRLVIGLRRRLREAGMEPLPAPAKKTNPGGSDARNDPRG